MFSSIKGYELASLPRQSSKLELSAYSSLFGDPDQANVSEILSSSEATNLSLPLGEAVDSAVSSSATVQRAVKWARQIPIWSG